MATLAEAEARVEKGDAAIRQREASDKAVPPAWYEAYDQAIIEMVGTYERDHPLETARYRQSPGRGSAPLVQYNRLPGVR